MIDLEDKPDWNIPQEKLYKKIANKAGAFVWLYNACADYYTKLQIWMNIVLCVVIFVLGSSGIPTLFTSGWSGAKFINLSIQIAMICVGVFGVINKQLNYTERIKEYSVASEKNTYLFMEIRKELAKDTGQRLMFAEFNEKISTMEIEISQNQIIVPDRIITSYYKKMGDQAIKYEDLFGNKIQDDDNNILIRSHGGTVYKLEKYINQ